MESVEQILKEELTTLQSDIIARHEASGQVASGKTRDSFHYELTSPFSGQLLGANYSGVLERGRRPGKVPYDFKDILRRWAAAKGISFKNENQFSTWAYFVTKKIREEGTALYRSGKTQDIFETPISEFQNRLAHRIANSYQIEILNKIFSNGKF